MHTGAFLTNPRLSFVRGEIEGILRYVTLEFMPGPGEPVVDFSLLTEGQLSLLYISLVLTAQAIGREALAGRLTTFDVDRLRPPVFTLLAVEEPENSLSPHYLGRVWRRCRACPTAMTRRQSSPPSPRRSCGGSSRPRCATSGWMTSGARCSPVRQRRVHAVDPNVVRDERHGLGDRIPRWLHPGSEGRTRLIFRGGHRE
jgi:hypothetical protein